MIDCMLFSKDDYESIMSHLKSARVICDTASMQRFSGGISGYHIGEIDRQLEAIEALLKKGGL